jgi:hypothetical protein
LRHGQHLGRRAGEQLAIGATPCAIALRGLIRIGPGGSLIEVERARRERRRLVAPYPARMRPLVAWYILYVA